MSAQGGILCLARRKRKYDGSEAAPWDLQNCLDSMMLSRPVQPSMSRRTYEGKFTSRLTALRTPISRPRMPASEPSRKEFARAGSRKQSYVHFLGSLKFLVLIKNATRIVRNRLTDSVNQGEESHHVDFNMIIHDVSRRVSAGGRRSKIQDLRQASSTITYEPF